MRWRSEARLFKAVRGKRLGLVRVDAELVMRDLGAVLGEIRAVLALLRA